MASTITKPQFLSKWMLRFASNDVFRIAEEDFQEFAADVDNLLDQHTNQVRGTPKLVLDLAARDALSVKVLTVGTDCIVLNALTASAGDEGGAVSGGLQIYKLVFAGAAEPGSFQIPGDVVVGVSAVRVKWVEADSKEAALPTAQYFDPTRPVYELGENMKFAASGYVDFYEPKKRLVKPTGGVQPEPVGGGPNDLNWRLIGGLSPSPLYSNVTYPELLALWGEEAFGPGRVYFIYDPQGIKPTVRVEALDGRQLRLDQAQQYNAATRTYSDGTYSLEENAFVPGNPEGVFAQDLYIGTSLSTSYPSSLSVDRNAYPYTTHTQLAKHNWVQLHGNPLGFFGLGFSGSELPYIRSQVPELIAQVSAHAEKVFCVVEGGINDLGLNRGVETVWLRMVALCTDLHQAGIIPIVCTTTTARVVYNSRQPYETLAAAQAAFNQRVIDRAGELFCPVVIALHTDWRLRDDNFEVYQVDHIHETPDGRAVRAELVARGLEAARKGLTGHVITGQAQKNGSLPAGTGGSDKAFEEAEIVGNQLVLTTGLGSQKTLALPSYAEFDSKFIVGYPDQQEWTTTPQMSGVLTQVSVSNVAGSVEYRKNGDVVPLGTVFEPGVTLKVSITRANNSLAALVTNRLA